MSASEIDWKRPIASASVMHCDRGLGEIGGDARVLLRAAEPEQAEPRHQHDAGQRIEHLLAAADAGVVAREILLVVVDEGRDGGSCGRALEVVELAGLRAPAAISGGSWCGW